MVVWLATGVRPLEILAFVGYEAVFVLAPGVLCLRALLRRRGSPLTQVAIGMPLGHALELAAFMATAAAGARWLFFLYPPLVCGVAAWLAHRRPSAARAPCLPAARAPAWATAAVVGVAIALLGFGAFAENPLPRTVSSVVLYQDSVFDVALAAEARHHWPLTDPNVSGEPLRYHVFVFMQAAAVNQATGIPLDVIMLRLIPVIIVLLIGLQLAWLAGRAVPGAPWVAPGAVAIMLLANELDVDTLRAGPFVGLFFYDLPISPTFAFGLPFFIAATGILLYVVTRRDRPEPGIWLVLAALFAAGMGAKASTLSVLLAALGLFLVTRAIVDRTVDRCALGAFGVGLGAFVVVYVALFSGGGGAAGTVIEPFAFVTSGVLPDAYSGTIAKLLAGIAGTGALLAPWLGALLLVGRIRGEQRTAALWLAAVATAAFVPFALIYQPGLANVYFLNYGVPAAAVLSAWGVALAWSRVRARARALAALAAAAAAAVVAAVLLRSSAPETATLTAAGYLKFYAAVVALVLVVAVVVERRTWAAAALAITMVVAVTLLDKPLDILPEWVEKETAGDPHHDADRAAGPWGIDTQLVAGLRWLRGHSDPDDTLAVEIQRTAPSGPPRYFNYAAFAERRTFLGGWDYTSDALVHAADERAGLPFAARRALNDAAFRGDRHALRILRRRHGVRFLLVDLRHGAAKPVLDRELRRVYANPALRVYRLD